MSCPIEARAEERAEEQVREPECPQRRKSDNGGCVLIVDDEVETCTLIRQACSHESFGVECAHNGFEALYKYRAARKLGLPYALILLDVVMPGKSGLMVAEEIRHGGDHETSLVFLTAENSPLVEMRSQSSQGIAVWEKPEALTDINSRIRQVLAE